MSSLADRPWTATDCEAVAAMILEGASMRQIASEFEITRNAVIGRIHRDRMLLRLMKRQGYRLPRTKPKPSPKPLKQKPPPPPVIPEFHRDWSGWEEKEAAATMSKEGIEPEVFGPATPASPPGKPLLQRGWNQCAYPVLDAPDVTGGFLFCCAAVVEGSSYCAEHRRRCIVRGGP